MTEFVGENGSGKSQLCLQLLLETVSGRRRFGDDEDDDDDDDGGFSAVYVTTEGQFPVERLREIWRERRKMQRRRQWEKEKRNVKNNNPGVREEEDAQRRRRKEEEREDEEDERRVLDSIYVFQAMGNAENCWEVLRSVSTVLCSTESRSSGGDGSNSNRRSKKKKRKEKNGGEDEEDEEDEEEREIRRKPVKLIVIDSLTAPFREDLEEDDRGKSEKQRNAQRVILRAQFLYRITHLLKEFAWKHDLAVVVTNHVVDSFDDEDEDERCANERRVFQTSTKHQREHEEEEEKEGKEEEETDCYGKRAFPKRFFTSNRFVKPGLGLAWANCPNSSVFLSRDDTDDCGEKSRRRRRRRRADAFRSPFAEAQSCAFRIEKEGIVNDNDDDELEYS
jgi:RecA/RadA recombinase